MIRRALVAAALLALVACGDNDPKDGDDAGPIDAGVDAPADAPTDAPPDANTFTTFVIDQIQNQTNATGSPAAFTTFSTLPDPDQANPGAYAPLFP